MNSIELIDKKEQLKNQAEAILTKAQNEQRKLNEGESTEFNSLKMQIAEVEDELRNLNNKLNKEVKMEKFSLLKAINDVANNRQLDERSQEVVNEGVSEMRKAGLSYSGQIQLPVEERADVQATVATAGAEAVAVDKLNILEPLRANLVLTSAGANYMTGLVGNVSIPVYSGSNVGWAGEIEAAKDGAGTFSEVTLEPKRITAYIDISKQFLIQDSVSAEALLRSDIVKAITNKLEATILGDGAGDSKTPAGLFNSASAMTAVDYKNIVAFMQELEEANVSGEVKYIVSPAIKAALKTTSKDAGSGRFLMEGNEIDGVTALCTSACKGIVLGNFSDYIIAQFGAIDLTVDPYTQAANGKVRLVVNAYFDAKPRRTEAFVAKKLSE
jgi:HK97 family phage major capsid protein